MAIIVIILATLLMTFAYGIIVQRYRIFPFHLIAEVEEAVNWSLKKRPGRLAWYYRLSDHKVMVSSAEGFSDSGLKTAVCW